MIHHLKQIAHFIMTSVSLITAFGVFMHDGRVDKATLTAFRIYERPTLVATSGLTQFKDFISTDAHTHPDHNTARSLFASFNYQSPSVPPREKSQLRRHLLQNFEPQGRHAFDNSNLPILT